MAARFTGRVGGSVPAERKGLEEAASRGTNTPAQRASMHRVVFAPQRSGQGVAQEVHLVLDCGYATKWPAGQPIPAEVTCDACSRRGFCEWFSGKKA